MPAEPLDEIGIARVAALINQWAADEAGSNPLVIGIEFIGEDRRWLVRLRGDDKAIITVWLTLRERTLHVETYFMPAPEDNLAGCYEYLLRLNSRLFAVKFAIGNEDAVYLVGQVPVETVDEARLDWLVGSAYSATEQHFRTALSLGFASRFRT